MRCRASTLQTPQLRLFGLRFRVSIHPGFPVRRWKQNREEKGRDRREETKGLKNSHTTDQDLGRQETLRFGNLGFRVEGLGLRV